MRFQRTHFQYFCFHGLLKISFFSLVDDMKLSAGVPRNKITDHLLQVDFNDDVMERLLNVSCNIVEYRCFHTCIGQPYYVAETIQHFSITKELNSERWFLCTNMAVNL